MCFFNKPVIESVQSSIQVVDVGEMRQGLCGQTPSRGLPRVCHLTRLLLLQLVVLVWSILCSDRGVCVYLCVNVREYEKDR